MKNFEQFKKFVEEIKKAEQVVKQANEANLPPPKKEVDMLNEYNKTLSKRRTK